MSKRTIDGVIDNKESGLNALLPDQSSQGGKVLGTNGTTPSWVAAALKRWTGTGWVLIDTTGV